MWGNLTGVRVACLALLFILTGIASAERQIGIPTARKLSTGTVKYEIRYDAKDYLNEQYLGIGLTPFWELELSDSDNRDTTFDLTYNLITPFTDLSPGIAFGVQDVLDQSEHGVRPFAVATFRQGFFVIGGEQPADISIGINYSHRRICPMIGVTVPFSEEVRILAEHDGRMLSAGVEIRPLRPLTISFFIRDTRPTIGFSLRHKF